MLHNLVETGAKLLQVDLSQQQVSKLLAYLDLIVQWNKTHNLSRVVAKEEMISYHLLDSLSLVSHLNCGNILDVGSGAGLPGVPLAIALDTPVILLDSQIKRVHFLEHVAATLCIGNVTVVHARIQDYNNEAGFANIVSRAFTSLSGYYDAVKHLVTATTKVVAMKGRDVSISEELLGLPSHNVKVVPVSVPYLDAQRHLVFL